MNESTNAAIPVVRENILVIRIVAGIIDAVVLGVLFFVLAAFLGDSDSGDGGFSVSLSGLPFILYIALSFSYYFLLENSRGQTLGKMAMKIKVVSIEGPLTPGKVAVRTILRVIDGFFFYAVAVVVIAVSKNQQRIGDMAAGTTVVRS
jgi:uncharacterized RDD family membrane protein YckC